MTGQHYRSVKEARGSKSDNVRVCRLRNANGEVVEGGKALQVLKRPF